MFNAKTGLNTDIAKLLSYSKKCVDRELAYHKESAMKSVGMTVPEFTKVLYRYFGEEK